jgi:hypothetical protein
MPVLVPLRSFLSQFSTVKQGLLKVVVLQFSIQKRQSYKGTGRYEHLHTRIPPCVMLSATALCTRRTEQWSLHALS